MSCVHLNQTRVQWLGSFTNCQILSNMCFMRVDAAHKTASIKSKKSNAITKAEYSANSKSQNFFHVFEGVASIHSQSDQHCGDDQTSLIFSKLGVPKAFDLFTMTQVDHSFSGYARKRVNKFGRGLPPHLAFPKLLCS